MRRDGFRFICIRKPGKAAVRYMKTHRWSMSKSIHASARSFGTALVASCAVATSAEAHGFGQRYDLPLPLSLYLFGTAAAVVLSFVIVGLFGRHAPGASGYTRIR